MARMSQAGEAFLKCAFAPPDFNTDPGKGIPDLYQGKVLSRKDVLTSTINPPKGFDTYYLMCPTPGVAYWQAAVANGASINDASFTPVPYPSWTSVFGAGGSARSDNVSAYRYASTCVGIYPTSNVQQFAGAIQVWKCSLELVSHIIGVGTPSVLTPIWTVCGTESILAVGNENYSDSFIKGMFSQSICNEPDFEFRPIIDNIGAVPSGTTTLATAGMTVKFSTIAAGTSTVGMVGMGAMETIIIKISTPDNTVNSAIMKNWACIEYKPNTSSAFYTFAHESPAHDPVAMEAYREVAKSVPVAVPCSQNGSFWARVVNILRGGLSLASRVPGPIGMTAMGFSGIMDMMTGLSM